jgi:hypothetical protein
MGFGPRENRAGLGFCGLIICDETVMKTGFFEPFYGQRVRESNPRDNSGYRANGLT